MTVQIAEKLAHFSGDGMGCRFILVRQHRAMAFFGISGHWNARFCELKGGRSRHRCHLNCFRQSHSASLRLLVVVALAKYQALCRPQPLNPRVSVSSRCFPLFFCAEVV
jgi:hypothetical protein